MVRICGFLIMPYAVPADMVNWRSDEHGNHLQVYARYLALLRSMGVEFHRHPALCVSPNTRGREHDTWASA